MDISQLLTDFGALVILYAPVVLGYLTQIIDWVVTYKKIAKLNVAGQVQPVLNEVHKLNTTCLDLIEQNAELIKINTELRQELENKQAKLEEAIDKQTEFLNNIVQENINLRADLRRKTDGSKQDN